MNHIEALALLTAIELAISTGKYRPTLGEGQFILSLDSQCRTPQKISEAQSKWLSAIYRISQGAYKKRWTRIEKI